MIGDIINKVKFFINKVWCTMLKVSANKLLKENFMCRSSLKVEKKGKKFGVVNQFGMKIVPVEYDYVKIFDNELILTRNFNSDGSHYMSGLYEKNGSVLLPFEKCELLFVFDLEAPFGERRKFLVLKKVGDEIEFYSAMCYEADCYLRKEEYESVQFMDDFVAIRCGKDCYILDF